jgi:hypothetical protein
MRMCDKVMQIVSDAGLLVASNAVIRKVWLRAGRMYGTYNGKRVVSIARGIWEVSNG